MFKNSVLVLVVLLFVAFSGCLEPEVDQPDFMEGNEDDPLEFIPDAEPGASINPAPISGNCENQTTQVGKDICAFNSAIEYNDVSYCSTISELWQENNCVNAVASQKLDTSICENVKVDSEFGEDNTNVKYGCIAEVALEVLYTQECSQLEGTQWESTCWNRVLQICSEISDQGWREVCIKKGAIDAGDETKCLLLHGFEKDTCLEEIAVAYQNQTICDSIEDETINASCLSRTAPGYFPDLPPLDKQGCDDMEGQVVVGTDCAVGETNFGSVTGEAAPSICCVLE
tara:strand:+ start:10814 stop:11671 length:858 start_codon:yes stop_codon:yes gene_type:complete